VGTIRTLSRQPAAKKLPLKKGELRRVSLKNFKNGGKKQVSFRTRHSVPVSERDTET